MAGRRPRWWRQSARLRGPRSWPRGALGPPTAARRNVTRGRPGSDSSWRSRPRWRLPSAQRRHASEPPLPTMARPRRMSRWPRAASARCAGTKTKAVGTGQPQMPTDCAGGTPCQKHPSAAAQVEWPGGAPPAAQPPSKVIVPVNARTADKLLEPRHFPGYVKRGAVGDHVEPSVGGDLG
jgi:hypothetical protein